MFANDTKELYERGDPEAFGPPGFGASWPGELRTEALIKGENNIWVAYLKGYGRDFSGISDYAQRIGVLVNSTPGFFHGLNTLWHEFGHAAGLAHRSDSPVMAYDNKTIFDYLGTARPWDNPTIISALENRTLASLEDAELEWGVKEPFTYGVYMTPLSIVTKDWQYLFCRHSDNWVISLVFREIFWIEGGIERRVETKLYRLDIPPQALLALFAPSEKHYLDAASGGDLFHVPPPQTNPDIEYNSTGRYWGKVALNIVSDPFFLLAVGLIVWRSSRLFFNIKSAKKKEECDDGLF